MTAETTPVDQHTSTCCVDRDRSTHVKPLGSQRREYVMAFHGLYFSPKSDVAASSQPTVAAVVNWSPDAAASHEPAVAAAAKSHPTVQ